MHNNDNLPDAEQMLRDVREIEQRQRAVELIAKHALRSLTPAQMERAIDAAFAELLEVDGLLNARRSVENHRDAAFWIRELKVAAHA